MIATLPFVAHEEWWASLKHGGLLITPSRLTEFFPRALAPLPAYIVDRLRRDVLRIQDGDAAHVGTMLDTVLEDVLGLDKEWWVKGSALEGKWSQRSMTRDLIKPRRIWLDPNGGVLPVFVPEGDAIATRLGIGRGKRSISRAIEWLRKAGQSIALVTNGRQWRLVHAGADYDAWCEWDIDLWFEEGIPAAQVSALRLLLGQQALHPPSLDEPCALVAAIQASRQGQGEISEVLGERVRKAVELLIRESAETIAQLPTSGAQAVSPRHIYIAATRVIMRCVVILFAEARDLLPRDNPIYHGSYGIQGLREQLDRLAGGRVERLRSSQSAWARLLGLFQLVNYGSAHEALPVPRYGGGLFAAGSLEAKDPILRALSAFENPTKPLSDAIVHHILDLLCRSQVKVRQGRGSRWVPAPVDFSDLSSEYIGILYEGLLDFELRQAGEDDPVIFLNLGDQPALPLTRLEGMDATALATLVEKLKQKTSAGEEEEAEVEETADEEAAGEDAIEAEADIDAVETDRDDSEEVDRLEQVRERAQRWAVRAVEAGKLVAKPRSKKPEAQAEYEKAVNKAAAGLIARVVLPGEWFLIRWGGTRKGSGTFYTRPQLAIPTTRRMLQPLVYNDDSTPRDPEDILALKICDPAMGSGSFLIAALRYLTDVLYESLHYYDRIPAQGSDVLCRLPDGTKTNLMFDRTLPVPPDHPEFESRLKAALRRYVVEWCIYGVDIDPLAVELARLSLWVETMDRSLSFSFLDHKLKCGNSLVGCWFEQFQDYPVMAWEREGGDKDHDRFVHHFREFVATKGKKKGETQQSGDRWNQAIKDVKNDVVRSELRNLLQKLDPQLKLPLPQFELPELPERTHQEAMQTLQAVHQSAFNPQEQEQTYQEQIERRDAYRLLKLAFNTWCAVWFWPPEQLDIAPTPLRFYEMPAETQAIVEQLTEQYQFFHWELEFPDVFNSLDAGFDGAIGNPPWEIQKPNSKEFFSNIDPLYRTYNKQEALRQQQEYFDRDPAVERDWLAYCDRLKALANWSRYAAFPFGDYTVEEVTGSKFTLSRSTQESRYLHDLWRDRRSERHRGYTTSHYPFRKQGSADINTYKMFSELGYTITREGGRFGFITPSGIYSDKGSGQLRDLYLKRCQWTHLYAFQNERFVFGSIHHSFKMVYAVVTKGGITEAIATRFRLGPGDSPEEIELVADILNGKYLSVPVAQILQFSPKTGALLEIRTPRDLMILEKMYANGILLGDDSPQGWGIRYATEFHMTNDSKLFPPRPQWEAKGYRSNEYGHWLKGNWRAIASRESGVGNGGGDRSILEPGLILSADGSAVIHVDEVEDIALPLYEGKMIWHFDLSWSRYISGSGNRSVWKSSDWEDKRIEPQFLMQLKEHEGFSNYSKLMIRDVTSSTNTRTFISAVVPDFPSGHNIPRLLECSIPTSAQLALESVICSFTFDYLSRNRLAGSHVILSLIEELAVLPKTKQFLQDKVALLAARLSLAHNNLSPSWLQLTQSFDELKNKHWKQHWAIAPYERLRLRCILDAIVAHLYGLDEDDFRWILRDCDHPIERVNDNAIARSFDPKGFWRVDKEKPPELRHTVLSLIAFHDLDRLGLETFLTINDGEGWMLPETIRLADYGLGHDDRAREHQPVAAQLGDRFLPWQLEGTVEESWQECERHAENLKRLLGTLEPQPEIAAQETSLPPSDPNFKPPTDLFGNPLPTDLFGNVIEEKPRRKKR